MDWGKYRSSTFDELIQADGKPRPAAHNLVKYLTSLSARDLAERKQAAEVAAKVMGVTFTVYSEGRNVDRALPFDLIPRTIDRVEWQRTEKGLKQRIHALNLFIGDIYGDQKIIKDRVFPRSLLKDSVNFRKQCVGIRPPLGVWAHICGSDLVRDAHGTLFVLTPGIYNSAYFEHCYLAQSMGIELVEGGDLFVDDDDCTYMRTVYGPRRVDVIYRRVDDMFIDPEAFHPDSLLGVRGLIRSWRAGKVALANAPGAGVADDKLVYTFVPKMIQYYLGEDAILPNVPSFLCYDDKEREHVLSNLDKLVVKPANESGGYGMLIGPRASKREREKFRKLIQADPRNYMAQPTLQLSTAPIVTDKGPEPRHLDLRPFILSGKKTYVTTGGLTRVAMKKNSLVVNSSQGGGAKDTWIVDLEEAS